MMEFAQKYGVPLLQSAEMTSPLMSSLIQALSTELAPASPATACWWKYTAKVS